MRSEPPSLSIPAPTPRLTSSDVEIVRIGSDLQGQRIDNFLMGHVKGVPRSHLYRVLRRGEVRVNKGRVKPGYRLQMGDLVRIPPLRSAPATTSKCPSQDRLSRLIESVIYEDERLMVLNKPAGMAVHGGSGLSWGLIEAIRRSRPDLPELELVHRLDRETSGCLLLAKRRSTLRELHRLLREGAVGKRYLALLAGHLERPELWVEAPLRKNRLRSGERLVCIDPEQGKAARTLFRSLRRLGDYTLVEVKLDTGRTHQIRVHAASLGVPVVGDEKYGETEANSHLRRLGLRRLFLHACTLTFCPSYKEQALHITAPLPDDLRILIEMLGSGGCVSS